MKKVTKEVSIIKDGKKHVVGSVVVPIYETIADLSENEEPQHILDMFNKGNVIYLMGNERNKHKPSVTGKKDRLYIAMSLLTTEEFQSTGGDKNKLQELLASDEITARVEDYLAEQEAENE